MAHGDLELKVGDIILGSKDSFIVKFMRIFQKDPVVYGHAMVMISEDKVAEAKWRVQITPLAKILAKQHHRKIIRYKDLTDHQASLIPKRAVSLLDTRYSISRIVLQMFDHFFGTNWFSNLSKSTKSQVCSTFVAWVYYASCKIQFNDVTWRACEPDDIDDESIRNPRWEVLEEIA